uniref:BESS domain-containing protein n=1 Tax=Strongyloides venezuelensis TaxID=75913 RepID=A0A0K0G2E6_STRVS
MVVNDGNVENRDNEGMTADGRNIENELENLDSSISDIEEDDTSKFFNEVFIACDENLNDDDKNNEIYDGCRIKMNVFISLLLKIKMRDQISDYAMKDLLGLINMLLPEKNRLPRTMRELRTLMRNMCTDIDRIYSQVKEEQVYRNIDGKDAVVGRMLIFPSNEIIDGIVRWNSKDLFKQYDGEVKELTVKLHTDGCQLSNSSKIGV